MNKYLLSYCLLLFLPQCKKIKQAQAFDPVKKQIENRIDVSPQWPEMPILHAQQLPTDKRITLNDAIAFAIAHNVSLQAQFQQVGIKKADLIQAGFFSNPDIQTIFKLPTNSTVRADIEISANFTLSDLWQVPLRKKVAQKDLEATSHMIVTTLLELRKKVQLAYFNCLYAEKLAHTTQKIVAIVDEMYERTLYRYTFGFVNQLEISFMQSQKAQWRAKAINAQAQVKNALLALTNVLGAPISAAPISLCMPEMKDISTISFKALEDSALQTHPIILLEQTKIAKAEASIRYEKSRIIESVQFGVAYERDFESPAAGVGPALNLKLPLFNTNYGNIERARYEKNEAEQNLLVTQRFLKKELATAHINYSHLRKQLKEYADIALPALNEAVAFSKQYFDSMQINLITFFNAQITMLETELTYLHIMQNLAIAQVDLEFFAGHSLT